MQTLEAPAPAPVNPNEAPIAVIDIPPASHEYAAHRKETDELNRLVNPTRGEGVLTGQPTPIERGENAWADVPTDLAPAPGETHPADQMPSTRQFAKAVIAHRHRLDH